MRFGKRRKRVKEETYINIRLLEVAVERKNDESGVQHQGEDCCQNQENLAMIVVKIIIRNQLGPKKRAF